MQTVCRSWIGADQGKQVKMISRRVLWEQTVTVYNRCKTHVLGDVGKFCGGGEEEVCKCSKCGNTRAASSFPFGTSSPSASQREKITVVFRPGSLGIGAYWSTGTVKYVVSGGQGEREQVKAGWRFLDVNGITYSESVLDRHVNGHVPFQVTFGVGDMGTIGEHLQLESKTGRSFGNRGIDDHGGKHPDAAVRLADAKVMDALVSHINRMGIKFSPRSSSVFHTKRPSNLSAGEYLQTLRERCGCDDECFIIAHMYMERIAKTHPEVSVDSNSIHRLLAACLLLSIKFHEDDHYSNHCYAKMAGISGRELDELELQVLKLLNWNVVVKCSEYESFVEHISKPVIPRQPHQYELARCARLGGA